MMVEVKITFDPSEETLEQAVSKMLGQRAAEAPETETSKPEKLKTDKAEKKAATEAPASEPEAPAPDPAPELPKTDPAVTKTDIRAIATAISKAGKKAELKAALEAFGATKLSDVKEADYPALKKKLEAINA